MGITSGVAHGVPWEILVGDVRVALAPLPEKSVQTCITSPPYWGLRDYGSDGQLGLESTPAEYVRNMVDVFAGVWRVLKDDGTLWLNLGDSYCSVGGVHDGRSDNQSGVGAGDRVWREGSARADGNVRDDGHSRRNRNGLTVAGLKPKDLVGIPWMVAFALREAGWYLRSDIIWAKPNPMPESVTDRPTKAHEYLFLLTKAAKYYYDAAAIREAAAEPDRVRRNEAYGGKNGASVRHGAQSSVSGTITTRNKRTVWTVTPQPYRGAHFATFPEKLIEPCILAGSRPGDTVLDPFAGSGTTGLVATRHHRHFIGCELNPDYVVLAAQRIEDVRVGKRKQMALAAAA